MSKRNRQMQHPAGKKYKEATGVFSASSSGFGFFLPDDESGKEYFIPPHGVGNAIDGDRVQAKIYYPDSAGNVLGYPSKGPVAYIINILERKRVFTVANMTSRHTAAPLDRHLPDELPVNSVPRGVKTGDWVKLRLLANGKKFTERLRGSVEENLGRAGTVRGDLNAVMAEFKLEGPYTEAEEKAASALTMEKIARTDLRHLFTVTIDPSDACDFDDALSIEVSGKNEVTLGVHIADVAAWIQPGTKFDKAALKRGFSAYLPGRFLPMLPKKLTKKISLQQNKDSVAHTVLFTVRRSDGKILATRRVHSTVRVNARLSYDEVQRYLSDASQAPAEWSRELKENLSLLALIAKRFRAKRAKEEGFLQLDTVETRAICDEKTGKVTALERREQREADQLVEEFMLAANSAVAAELITKKVAGLFRVHPYPMPERIEEFSSFVEASFGLKTGDILASRENCRKFLENLPDDHRKSVIVSAFLRALPRAVYAEDPSIHFGLGKLQYSHFTSPIRRYTDLAIHQQLWSMDQNTRLRSKKRFGELAITCSAQEEAVDNAFFAANDRMILHYLLQHDFLGKGEIFQAVIAKVTSAGLLCEVSDLGLYGFVPASHLRGGYQRSRVQRTKALRAGSHTEYVPGDFIYLILDSLDMVRGSALFRIAL